MFRNNKGISLVELLVVVAMIAVLAAVAGPRLTEYTVQGSNAMAAADLRNAVAAEKAFFADWGVYASSAMGAVPGTGSVLNDYWNNTGRIWATSINGTAPRVTIPDPGFQITVSQNVGVIINTSSMGGSYTMGSKNAMGDRCFGVDSDMKEVYWVNGVVGMPMSSSAVPSAIAGGVSDFAGVGGVMPCLGIDNQIVWTAL